MSDQSKITFLEELVKDTKKDIKNGFILGLVGLVFASSGFFSYVADLFGLNLGWLALGIIGSALIAGAFYIMIRADIQEGRWKRQFRNVTRKGNTSIVKNPERESSADHDEEYFDGNYEKWKDPFEEDKE